MFPHRHPLCGLTCQEEVIVTGARPDIARYVAGLGACLTCPSSTLSRTKGHDQTASIGSRPASSREVYWKQQCWTGILVSSDLSLFQRQNLANVTEVPALAARYRPTRLESPTEGSAVGRYGVWGLSPARQEAGSGGENVCEETKNSQSPALFAAHATRTWFRCHPWRGCGSWCRPRANTCLRCEHAA